MSVKFDIDRFLAESFASRPSSGPSALGFPPASGAPMDARAASRHPSTPSHSSIGRAIRVVLGALLYPLRVLDYWVHAAVYAATSPIRSFAWSSRSDELRYVVLGPILAVLSGPLLDPLVASLFDWVPGRRLYAFGLVSLAAWTICFVRLFDAKSHSYRYTDVRRYAALWAHGLLWIAGLLFHPLFAAVTRASEFVPFADARWLIFVAFGAVAVVWHFAEWWPTYHSPAVVFANPIPRRANPYVPPRVLSPHRDWFPNAYAAADGIFERGTRLTPIAQLSEQAEAHWDEHDVPPRRSR